MDPVKLSEIEFLQEEFKKLYHKLSNTMFSIQATGQNYRVINNWDEKGILSSDRLNVKGWRKFNWFELAWVEIISICRSFGLSLLAIRAVKNQLWKNANIYISDDTDSHIKIFEKTIVSSFLHSKEYILQIRMDGSCEILESTMNRPHVPFPCLSIPIKPIIEEILSKDAIEFAESTRLDQYSKEELAAVDIVNKNGYEKIILSFANDRPLIIRSDEDKDKNKKDIIEWLYKRNYKSMMLLQPGGKVISLQGKQTS